jgi:hypothetical protein
MKENKVSFENLFKVFSSETFLKRKGLGGDMPFYIQAYDPTEGIYIQKSLMALKKKLIEAGITVKEIDLFQIIVNKFQEDNILEQVLNAEKTNSKQRFLKLIRGPIKIETSIIPMLKQEIESELPQIIFLTGIGASYPIIRAHTFLNNLHTIINTSSLVMFYPGTFTDTSLSLFSNHKEDNYYQAYNLNHFKI